MEIVTKIAPIALALIMLGLGLGLTVQDFTRVVKTPKDFMVGLISQLLILPIVAFILILDTFKDILIKIFPNIKILLNNLYETLKDISLFFYDLVS